MEINWFLQLVWCKKLSCDGRKSIISIIFSVFNAAKKFFVYFSILILSLSLSFIFLIYTQNSTIIAADAILYVYMFVDACAFSDYLEFVDVLQKAESESRDSLDE